MENLSQDAQYLERGLNQTFPAYKSIVVLLANPLSDTSCFLARIYFLTQKVTRDIRLLSTCKIPLNLQQTTRFKLKLFCNVQCTFLSSIRICQF
jgi:hypothetical protein